MKYMNLHTQEAQWLQQDNLKYKWPKCFSLYIYNMFYSLSLILNIKLTKITQWCLQKRNIKRASERLEVKDGKSHAVQLTEGKLSWLH